MEKLELIEIENKDLHIERKEFLNIVNTQHSNNNIYVGISELGFCVRAKRTLMPNEMIYTFEGETISFLETKMKGQYECMTLQYDFNKYIDTEAPGCYVNHSCKPNAGIVNDFDLIALKKIEIHEEIRFDYSTTMDEDSYKMECKCGKESCRKVIGDFILLPVDLQKQYFKMGIVSNFIMKKYE